jgi:hypothetical protein
MTDPAPPREFTAVLARATELLLDDRQPREGEPGFCPTDPERLAEVIRVLAEIGLLPGADLTPEQAARYLDDWRERS